jgi:hypothetical protein
MWSPAWLLARSKDKSNNITVWDSRSKRRLDYGINAWRRGKSKAFGRSDIQPVAASAAWLADNLLEIRFRFYTTPFCAAIHCRFGEDHLDLQTFLNVSFGATERPPLTGFVAAHQS